MNLKICSWTAIIGAIIYFPIQWQLGWSTGANPIQFLLLPVFVIIYLGYFQLSKKFNTDLLKYAVYSILILEFLRVAFILYPGTQVFFWQPYSIIHWIVISIFAISMIKLKRGFGKLAIVISSLYLLTIIVGLINLAYIEILIGILIYINESILFFRASKKY